MSLQDWLSNGWLIEHKTSPQEIADILNIADRDLKDCKTTELSSDWKFNIGYNAALQCAIAALAAAGYRPSRESHHYRAIQSLNLTMGIYPNLIVQLDMFRKKRNISEYDRAGGTSDQEVSEMINLAEKLRDEVKSWIKQNYPDFLKG